MVVTAWVTALALATMAACGGKAGPEVPMTVDSSLAPPALANGKLMLYPDTGKTTTAAFASTGRRALIADGRIWQIRDGDRLVGALQIATVLPRVDLRESSIRTQFTSQILVGEVSRIRLAGQEVSVEPPSPGGKSVMVWYGLRTFQVLQLKGPDLAPEKLAEEIIRHEQTRPAWVPLPPTTEHSDS